MRGIECEFDAKHVEAFRRHCVKGETAQDVAAGLGLTADVAYKAASRIRTRLRAIVSEQIEAEG